MKYLKNLKIIRNFISDGEADSLVKLCDRKLNRISRNYQQNHFDSVINSYRECTFSDFPNTELLDRMKREAFLFSGRKEYQHPHILDLHKDGVISAHVDNINAFGKVICGLCLLSDCVMIFKKNNQEVFRVLLEKNCLYIQKDDTRFDLSHEIPREAEIDGKLIRKDRRISIMLRDII
ncbi:Alpha-ketoglutarate-dependent dioxygenase alkB 7, mitochondrial [Boothiomyces macroporosus]|uniref:Alpha-ketoglutarate-dependent dioxygenase alkB 7, mitochondrial n=1 Tax=Boothiomyces macroporosus TaxID=261099 RepID=A0AAD5UF93_9FUNG|nr:Alpha-ketoglutarate-dependent dioxygenase alkB 7, mitochondrial [Boothiomyces macroporosus]